MHAHSHSHAHAHHHHDDGVAARAGHDHDRAPMAMPARLLPSLLRLSALQRLAGAGVIVMLLWVLILRTIG